MSKPSLDPATANDAAARPVIGFLTDFGLDGAAAICRGVILTIARDAQIVDISHTVRKYAVRDGAYVLSAALPWLPVGVHLAVVDPGVGTARRPVGIRVTRGDVLIGPDNGLLRRAAERLGGIEEARLLENRTLMLPVVSATFHGRDVFAPMAAHLAAGAPFDLVGPVVDAASLAPLELASAAVQPGEVGTVVEYVDSFGNLRLGATPRDLANGFGELGETAAFEVAFGSADDETGDRATTIARWSRTFGDAPTGVLVLYGDSSGQLAIAEVEGNAAGRLGVGTDTPISLRRA